MGDGSRTDVLAAEPRASLGRSLACRHWVVSCLRTSCKYPQLVKSYQRVEVGVSPLRIAWPGGILNAAQPMPFGRYSPQRRPVL